MYLQTTDSEEEYVKLAVKLGKNAEYRIQVSQMLAQRGAEIWERSDVARGWALFLERAHRGAIGAGNQNRMGSVDDNSSRDEAKGNTCSSMLSAGMKHFYDGDPASAEKIYHKVCVSFA